MIPRNLTDDHFRRACRHIDDEGIPAERQSVHYDLIIDGKRYPPKYVISLAALYAKGHEFPASAFNAVEAKNYFVAQKYDVVDRRIEAEMHLIVEDEASRFPEGGKRFRAHVRLERDTLISKKAKAKRWAETGALKCEVCEFDFVQRYGEAARGYIEAHHIVPVSQLNGISRTKISDLALVCSNCHRMLHRFKPLLTIAALKEMINLADR